MHNIVFMLRRSVCTAYKCSENAENGTDSFSRDCVTISRDHKNIFWLSSCFIFVLRTVSNWVELVALWMLGPANARSIRGVPGDELYWKSPSLFAVVFSACPTRWIRSRTVVAEGGGGGRLEQIRRQQNKRGSLPLLSFYGGVPPGVPHTRGNIRAQHVGFLHHPVHSFTLPS